MGLIERCGRCGGSPEFEGECPTCGHTIQTYVSKFEAESLRAQLRGAVEDREWLRGIVYEFLLTGPRKRTGLSDVEMQRFLSIHVGGQ